jgi:PAS domain S-box-containing protein
MAKKSLGLNKNDAKKERTESHLKKLEEKLAYYKQVVIGSNEAVIIQDFKGTVKAWNKSAERIYGFKEKEMLGENITKIIAKEERAKAIKNINSIKRGKPSFKVKQTRMAKNGQRVFVNITYSPIYEAEEIIEIGTTEEDVSELKKSFEILKESEGKYKSLVENTLDYIYLIGPKYQVISANASAKKALSIKFKNIIGKRVDELFPREVAQGYIQSLKKVFKSKKPLTVKGSKMVVGNRIAWLSVTLNPVKNSQGKVTAVIGVSHDITSEINAETKIKENENRFKELFNNMDECVAVYEVKNNGKYIIIKDLNRAAKKLEKINKKNIIGKKVEDVFKGVDEFGLLDVFKKVWKTGKAMHHPISFYKDTHRKGWRENFVFKLPSGEIVAIYSDVTEKKEAQEKIKKSEAEYRELALNLPLIIYRVHAKENNSMQFFNSMVKKITGYSEAELKKGKICSIEPLIIPSDRKIIIASINKAIKEKSSFALEYRLRHKNGSLKYLREQGRPIYGTDGRLEFIDGTITDITEKKKVENELEEISAKNQAILTSIGDGLIAIDKNGIITFVNQATGKMLGWDIKEIVGKPMRDICQALNEQGSPISYENRPVSKIVLSDKKTASTYIFNSTYYLRKDKTKFPVAITITPIIMDNEIIGAIEVFRDITKEKEIDKAKTEFVSLASHQLKTPLTMINWYSEILLDNSLGKINEEQKKHLNAIYNGGKRLVSLVNAMLNVSRIELGTFIVKPKLMSMADLAYSVIGEFEHELKNKKISLRKNFNKNIPKIPADPKLLRIILQNLLSNAVKYTLPKGKISLKINLLKAGRFVDGKKSTKDSIIISVTDNGIGIPKNQQNEIFKKLFRADNARNFNPDGTGLGLYIVKSIINQAGGEISFESIENKGTTFYASIPREGMKKKEGTKFLS